MNEEELFCKLFPEYVVNGKPLSPYFDLFESGYEQAEKRIAELEKKITSLEGQKSLHEGILWNDLHKLEKENAELRDKLNKIERKCRFNFVDLLHDVENESKQEDQLTKAEEIIKELLNSCFGYNSKTVNYEVKAKAEQFLKENA